jgi:hypothetical protein
VSAFSMLLVCVCPPAGPTVAARLGVRSGARVSVDLCSFIGLVPVWEAARAPSALPPPQSLRHAPSPIVC